LKRKVEGGNGKGDAKKTKSDIGSGSMDQGETVVAAVMVLSDLMCIAIDNQVSGDIAPLPCEDQAFSAL
jgi:hypothetical protein